MDILHQSQQNSTDFDTVLRKNGKSEAAYNKYNDKFPNNTLGWSLVSHNHGTVSGAEQSQPQRHVLPSPSPPCRGHRTALPRAASSPLTVFGIFSSKHKYKYRALHIILFIITPFLPLTLSFQLS